MGSGASGGEREDQRQRVPSDAYAAQRSGRSMDAPPRGRAVRPTWRRRRCCPGVRVIHVRPACVSSDACGPAQVRSGLRAARGACRSTGACCPVHALSAMCTPSRCTRAARCASARCASAPACAMFDVCPPGVRAGQGTRAAGYRRRQLCGPFGVRAMCLPSEIRPACVRSDAGAVGRACRRVGGPADVRLSSGARAACGLLGMRGVRRVPGVLAVRRVCHWVGGPADVLVAWCG